MKKIVLLGGNGFVGSNVAKVLSGNNIKYIIASRENGLDLRDQIACEVYFKKIKPDIIINCAAHVGSLNYVSKQAAEIISDNSRIILSLYEGLAKTSPDCLVINPLANCAFPANDEIYSEQNWMNGQVHRSVLSYGSSRRFLWSVGECFSMQYGIKSIYLFVPNMYGTNDSTDPNKAHALNALCSKFVKAIKSDQKEIIIWGTGIAIREWLFAEDFGRIILEIIKNPNMLGLTEPTNIAQNFGLSVKELVEIVKSNFNFKGSIVWDHAMPDGALKKVMDDRKFRKIFPDFLFTPFNIGIKKTIDYYLSVYPF